MLRMIIVDDEKLIRETIHHLIDWPALGIEIVGLCKNGFEAYEMILDEYPDIVMTDIQMPGFSGLDLIERIAQTDHNIEFILLSGYGEFEYAKQAMKWGVKYYLLKPSNEQQIMDAVRSAAKDCFSKRMSRQPEAEITVTTHSLKRNIIRNIIAESLSHNVDISELITLYGSYFDFKHTSYELYSLFFLEECNLTECLHRIYAFMDDYAPTVSIYAIYVKNTLLIFFENFTLSYEDLDAFFRSMALRNQTVDLQSDRQSFPNLALMLEHLVKRLHRYEMIYMMNGTHRVPTCNYKAVFPWLDEQITAISGADHAVSTPIAKALKEMLLSIEDADFLKALITHLLLKLSSNPSDITEFLLDIRDQTCLCDIQSIGLKKLDQLMVDATSPQKHRDFIEKTLSYVEANLSNPNMSLKWIAENYFFMNVDYVSKQFVKQTGEKFSNYLTTLRIKKAKALILSSNVEKIYEVAEQVGCGNNPQYFGQIFKKHTGLTPTEYLKKKNGELQ